jgi:hypothetical protein
MPPPNHPQAVLLVPKPAGQRGTGRHLDRHFRGLAARPPSPTARPSFDLGDVSAVAAARAEEQAAADRQALAQDVRDAAALVLAEAVAQSRGEVITAIKARHQSVVADLCKRARRLPPGASEQTALEAGGQHRADFLAARDAVAELARLREAIRLVDSHPPPEADDGLSAARAGSRPAHWPGRGWPRAGSPRTGRSAAWSSICPLRAYRNTTSGCRAAPSRPPVSLSFAPTDRHGGRGQRPCDTGRRAARGDARGPAAARSR